ncbi:MAG: tadA [Candidatus Saccharibacteria bacterium]|nr:tadA [Candidatus Saccharibacteria bacterium]
MYVPNEYYMGLAIDYARENVARGQHPVGAVVTRTLSMFNVDTRQQQVVQLVAGVGVNEVHNNSYKHAEAVAIEKAEVYHGRHQLRDLSAVLYTTHEPCPMCAGLIANTKLSGVVYGTSAVDATDLVRDQGIRWRSNAVSGLDIIRGRIEPGMPEQFIIGGFMREQCLELLQSAGQLAVASIEPII